MNGQKYITNLEKRVKELEQENLHLNRSLSICNWSEWRDHLVYDPAGKLVMAKARFDEVLTKQVRLPDGRVWEATLEEQREGVEKWKREMGL